MLSSWWAWLKAARLTSQSLIVLPLWAGVVQGGEQSDFLIWENLGSILLWGFFFQLFIVFSNDLADHEADCLNQQRNLFSGGSGVLVSGALSRRQLTAASGGAAIMTWVMVLALYCSGVSPMIVPATLVAFGLMGAYSFSPLKLSYRGGGELLQMLGVGGILPVMGFLSQGGYLMQFPWEDLWFFFPVQLAVALATTLPDEKADRMVGKRTFCTQVGRVTTAWIIVFLLVMSFLVLNFFQSESAQAQVGWWILAPVFLVVALAKKKPGSQCKLIQVGAALSAGLSLMGWYILR